MAIIGAVGRFSCSTRRNLRNPPSLNIQRVVELADQGKVDNGTIRSDAISGGRDLDHSDRRDARKPSCRAPTGGMTKTFTAAGRLTDSNSGDAPKSKVFGEARHHGNDPAAVQRAAVRGRHRPALFPVLPPAEPRRQGRPQLRQEPREDADARQGSITFSDVAGVRGGQGRSRRSRRVPPRDPKKFQKLGGRIPKGVLMVGSARYRQDARSPSAIAGEADVPFFSISGSDFVEMFVGVGASRVRDMFEQGRRTRPASSSSTKSTPWAAIAAAAWAAATTSASRRSTRCSSRWTASTPRKASSSSPRPTARTCSTPRSCARAASTARSYIDLPDVIGREEILRVHARKITLCRQRRPRHHRSRHPGLSGAELANLLNESALLSTGN